MMRALSSNVCAPGKDYFKFNLIFLTLVGLWRNDEWSKKWLFLYDAYETTMHILPIIYFVITSIGSYNCHNELTLFLANLDKNLVALHFITKYVIFTTNRQQVSTLITEIIHSGDKIPKRIINLMSIHVVVVTSLGMFVVTAFSGTALMNREMIVEAWMPFDPMKNLNHFLLAFQISVMLFTPCILRSNAIQGLICSLVMYLCEQLKELQKRIRALNYSLQSEEQMRSEFREIIIKHVRVMRLPSKRLTKLRPNTQNHLRRILTKTLSSLLFKLNFLDGFEYSEIMKTTFKEYFFIQNLAITVELCLNAVMITVVGFKEMKLLVSFLAFLCVGLLNAYIYCYLGNELIIQSENIAQAAYDAEWTSWPVGLQKDLLIVIRNAQRPLSLSAGGLANMSMQTFAQALYNGYSIFAVLNDAVD